MKIDQFESAYSSAITRSFDFNLKAFNQVNLLLLGFDDLSDSDKQSIIDNNVKKFFDSFDSCPEILLNQSLNATSQHLNVFLINNENLIADIKSISLVMQKILIEDNLPVVIIPIKLPKRYLSGEKRQRVLVSYDCFGDSGETIDYGITFCGQLGDLFISQVEDEKKFLKYSNNISKFIQIDRVHLNKKLEVVVFQEFKSIANNIKHSLLAKSPNVGVHSLVAKGDIVNEIKNSIDGYDIDVLILNRKQESFLSLFFEFLRKNKDLILVVI